MEKQLLRQLISIDSQLKKTNKQIVGLLRGVLRKAGFTVAVSAYTSGSVQRYNIKAIMKRTSKQRPLVFSGHTDTVNQAAGWSGSPLVPRSKKGRMYGLGASDMKGSIAAFITAINRSKKITRPIMILLDGDEEGEGKGGRLLTKKKVYSQATVIVGEPTDGQIRLGQKACYDIKITVSGRSRHASLSSYSMNTRDNAIVKMNRVITALRDYEKKIGQQKDKVYGRSTVSYGIISGGTSINSSADSASLVIDRRLLPSENIKKDYAQLVKVIKAVEPAARLSILFWGGAYHVGAKTPWVQKIQKKLRRVAGKPVSLQYRDGWTEASLFQNWGRVVIMGPGTHRAIHKPNESISLLELKRTTRLYQAFIEDETL